MRITRFCLDRSDSKAWHGCTCCFADPSSPSPAQVSSGDCPHLLFYGPPGAGKKTLIIGLLRQIYGPAVEKVHFPCSWQSEIPMPSLLLLIS